MPFLYYYPHKISPLTFTPPPHTHTHTQLCSSTRIQPMPYLQYKKTVLAEYEKHSRLTLAECRKLLKIDVNKTRKIFNLFVSRGWIVHIS